MRPAAGVALVVDDPMVLRLAVVVEVGVVVVVGGGFVVEVVVAAAVVAGMLVDGVAVDSGVVVPACSFGVSMVL